MFDKLGAALRQWPAASRPSKARLKGPAPGACWANSAASLMISADLLVDPLEFILAGFALAISRWRTCSIGSCSVRMFCTSSRERYFAGSDIEWPR